MPPKYSGLILIILRTWIASSQERSCIQTRLQCIRSGAVESFEKIVDLTEAVLNLVSLLGFGYLGLPIFVVLESFGSLHFYTVVEQVHCLNHSSCHEFRAGTEGSRLTTDLHIHRPNAEVQHVAG